MLFDKVGNTALLPTRDKRGITAFLSRKGSGPHTTFLQRRNEGRNTALLDKKVPSFCQERTRSTILAFSKGRQRQYCSFDKEGRWDDTALFPRRDKRAILAFFKE